MIKKCIEVVYMMHVLFPVHFYSKIEFCENNGLVTLYANKSMYTKRVQSYKHKHFTPPNHIVPVSVYSRPPDET